MNYQPNQPNQPTTPGMYPQATPPTSSKPGFFQQTVPLWLFLTTIITLVAIVAFLIGRSISTGTTATKASTTIQTNSSSGGPTDNTTGGNAESTPTQVTVTSSAKWKTVQSYSNTGDLKTGLFTVTAPWQLVSTCDPSSEDYNFAMGVNIEHPDGHFFIPYAINYACSTGDHNEQYVVDQGGGTFYLQIIGAGAWTLDVQEVDQ